MSYLKKLSITFLLAIGCVVGVTTISGCVSMGTAVADANQKPPVSTYQSRQPASRVFTAAVQAMGTFGKLQSSDRESGFIQGQKGNWTMSVSIKNAKQGTSVSLTARYVPSKQYDFNSRDGLTADYLALIQKELNEPLVRVE